jgi:hypothetical protein
MVNRLKLFFAILFYRSLGLANRGLGNLETAQDEKADEAIKMQALSDGNHYYAGCKSRTFPFLPVISIAHLFSNRTSTRKGY